MTGLAGSHAVPAPRERRRGRKRIKGSMVPEAEFASYYGRPILKRPTWKNPDVPLYLWVGGMAGSSSVIAVLGDATGRPLLRAGGRWTAFGGALVGTVALVHDLGRPARFLNMLRVFKPTSPLSVGSWILSPFAAFAGLAAAAEVADRIPVVGGLLGPTVGRAAASGAALFGPPLASYTGVLFADTAIPAWHEAHGELPVLFAASGAAAGAGVQLVITGLAGADARERRPVARLGVAGAVVELAAAHRMEATLDALPGGVGEVYRTGRAGRWNRLARAATATGAVLALAGARSRAAAVAGGVALATGSLATRFAVFEAGLASSQDPQHVIAPQKARLAERGRARADGSWLAGEGATSPVPRS